MLEDLAARLRSDLFVMDVGGKEWGALSITFENKESGKRIQKLVLNSRFPPNKITNSPKISHPSIVGDAVLRVVVKLRFPSGIDEVRARSGREGRQNASI